MVYVSLLKRQKGEIIFTRNERAGPSSFRIDSQAEGKGWKRAHSVGARERRKKEYLHPLPKQKNGSRREFSVLLYCRGEKDYPEISTESGEREGKTFLLKLCRGGGAARRAGSRI